MDDESQINTEGVDDGEDMEEEASDMELADTATTKKAKVIRIDPSDLPPIHHIPTIFSDLVRRFPKIQSVTSYLQGRKLRVATMCSGTESPLLALDLICRSIRDLYGMSLEVEHVFSCEIEPFKQAYIERNFKPPLLFRDVCELGDSHAYVIRICALFHGADHIILQNDSLRRVGTCSRRCRPARCGHILCRLFQPEQC